MGRPRPTDSSGDRGLDDHLEVTVSTILADHWPTTTPTTPSWATGTISYADEFEPVHVRPIFEAHGVDIAVEQYGDEAPTIVVLDLDEARLEPADWTAVAEAITRAVVVLVAARAEHATTTPTTATTGPTIGRQMVGAA
jgi:hypothetical protein